MTLEKKEKLSEEITKQTEEYLKTNKINVIKSVKTADEVIRDRKVGVNREQTYLGRS